MKKTNGRVARENILKTALNRLGVLSLGVRRVYKNRREIYARHLLRKFKSNENTRD